MTPESQRIAIAESLGWKWKETRRHHFGAVEPIREWTNPSGDNQGIHPQIPNYPEDLNACAEMEKTLDIDPDNADSPRYAYARALYNVCADKTQPFRATAAQRCEAFLRVKGLWKEEA